MEYTYKQLFSSDVTIFKQLLKVLGEAFEDIETYQTSVPSDNYLQSFLEKTHCIVLVAMKGDEVIGGLVAYELEKFEQDRREIYMYDLAVAEAYRRQGIATHLINELKTIAKTRKAYVIFVQADPEDMSAIKLYESLGIREDVHHFDIPVN